MSLASAARAMLDAYGGDFPDWLLPEAQQLALELAAVEAVEHGPFVVALEHMRIAKLIFAEVGDVRTCQKIDAALLAVERLAGRQVMGQAAEDERTAHRLAELPDPAPRTGAK